MSDVALRAGVSQATVSRYLAGMREPHSAIHARIEHAAVSLGYGDVVEPPCGPTTTVVLLMSRATHVAYGELVCAVAEASLRRARPLALSVVDQRADPHVVVDDVLALQPAALVVATPLDPMAQRRLAAYRIPIVSLNDHGLIAADTLVECTQRSSMRDLVTRLCAAGHRRFALLRGPAASVVAGARAEGALQAIAAFPGTGVVAAVGDFGYDSGAAAVRKLASTGLGFDAVVATNDAMALGALDALRDDLGAHVPRDVSVVGFDGVAEGAYAAYGLTTLRQPLAEMADAVLAAIERGVLTGRWPAARALPAQLVVRGSARLS